MVDVDEQPVPSPEPAPDPSTDDTGPDDEHYERPVDRFRATAVGSIVAAGLFGLAEVLEGRPPREEAAIVQEAPTRPIQTPRAMELLLDPDNPERSMVFLPPDAHTTPPADAPA